jgi:hypothetical protein
MDHVIRILRSQCGGNDGIHKIKDYGRVIDIHIPPDGNSLRSMESQPFFLTITRK